MTAFNVLTRMPVYQQRSEHQTAAKRHTRPLLQALTLLVFLLPLSRPNLFIDPPLLPLQTPTYVSSRRVTTSLLLYREHLWLLSRYCLDWTLGDSPRLWSQRVLKLQHTQRHNRFHYPLRSSGTVFLMEVNSSPSSHLRQPYREGPQLRPTSPS